MVDCMCWWHIDNMNRVLVGFCSACCCDAIRCVDGAYESNYSQLNDDEDDDTWLSRLDAGDEEACCPVL